MKPALREELDIIKDEFIISNEMIKEIATDFYNDMKEKRMLKMLRSYVTMDTDNVFYGEYIAIDVGGSNIRICKVKVLEGSVSIEKMIKFPLRTEAMDYTSSSYTLKYLIVKALEEMSPFLEKEKEYPLAITISFGLESKSKKNAKIIELSKGFELSETLGKDIYDILIEAIKEAKLNIIPELVVNDCVSTLATGKFYNSDADIALIVGTGHNACFTSETGEIINIESAGFNENLPITVFDGKYISKIPKEAEKLFEVLIGGKYINGTANIIMEHLIEKGLLKECKEISTPDMCHSLTNKMGDEFLEEQKEVIEEISKILFERAAKLIVAEIYAILMRIDENIDKKHTIIFDGSVYEKCEFFKEEISKTLNSVFLDKSKNISHKLQKDASTVGPAVIVACQS